MPKNILKIVKTFEPIMQFWCPSRFRVFRTIHTHSFFGRKKQKLWQFCHIWHLQLLRQTYKQTLRRTWQLYDRPGPDTDLTPYWFYLFYEFYPFWWFYRVYWFYPFYWSIRFPKFILLTGLICFTGFTHFTSLANLLVLPILLGFLFYWAYLFIGFNYFTGLPDWLVLLM